MLSSEEIKKIYQELQQKPTGKIARSLRKKLIEHEYATSLRHFTPLPHNRIHLNRFTPSTKLQEVIEKARTATTFTLDTESTNIFRQGNRPALIQIQVLSPTSNDSTVVLIEINHLPPQSSEEFAQIRLICRIVLHPSKTVYVWGNIHELDDFHTCGLFTKEQIASSHHRDLQVEVGNLGLCRHPRLTPTTSMAHVMIDKGPGEKWSLQDAVAVLLGEWLDKRLSRSPFDMGLDPNFQHPNPALRRRQELLSKYAANDCLAIQRLLLTIYNPLQAQTSRATRSLSDDEPRQGVNSPPNDEEAIDRTHFRTVHMKERHRTDDVDESSQHTNLIIHLHNQGRREPVPDSPPSPTTDHVKDIWDVNLQKNTSGRRVIIQGKKMNHPTTPPHPSQSPQTTATRTPLDNSGSSDDSLGTPQPKRVKSIEATIERHEDSLDRHQRRERHEGTTRDHEQLHRSPRRERYNRSPRHANRHVKFERNDDHDSRYERREEPLNQVTPTDITHNEDNRPERNNNGSRRRDRNEQEKHRRNRRATLKQRARHFRTEIIRRGIDPRFSIRTVKEILYHNEIPYKAVIKDRSKITGRTSLYIGLSRTSMLHEHEIKTRKLFTTESYNEFRKQAASERRPHQRQRH